VRERILTPGFPLPRGDEATERGGESPAAGAAETLPARALEGRAICNGRYLLRRKSGHSRTTVRFVAHDLHAEVDVDLDLHPDQAEDAGFRLGEARVDDTPPSLPLLTELELEQSPAQQAREREASRPSIVSDAWQAVRAIFRR
jgi:hypothetical protein